MEKEQNISGSIVDLGILRRLFVFATPYIKQFYILVLLTITLALLVPARPFLIQRTIDLEIANGDLNGLVNMIVILVILLFTQSIVQYYHTYLSGWLGQYIIKDIRIALFVDFFKLLVFDLLAIEYLHDIHACDMFLHK